MSRLKTMVVIGQKPKRQHRMLTEKELDKMGAMLGRGLLSST
jgi:hypothetical protein